MKTLVCSASVSENTGEERMREERERVDEMVGYWSGFCDDQCGCGWEHY